MKTLVTKKSTSLLSGIKNMMAGAKENFDSWTAPRDGQSTSSYRLEQPASYNRPALNQPRGNVLDGNYFIAWTGPLYLN